MQAIIMAGGVGSRLRPLTDDTPKPMVKIIDKPVLETIIERLKYFGIYDIGLTVN
ncbi:MAG: sugar phosphate nucleotidyltransferase, partial [Eubacteriales bacterium]|nr:sugar phosphate nucleotidyltransferase [Eubacteriales bacterium]